MFITHSFLSDFVCFDCDIVYLAFCFVTLIGFLLKFKFVPLSAVYVETS